MKRPLIIAMTLVALASAPAFAVEEHHPDQKPGAAAPAGDKAGPPAAADSGKMVQKMKANTQRMQEQLDKIARAKDPQERQMLLQEHMQTMRENIMMGQSLMMGGPGAAPGMGMMGGMGPGGMMGPGMMGMCPMMGMMGGGMMGGMAGGMGGMAGGMAPEVMMNRMQQMEKRLDMMQMMMEQMLKPQARPAQK
ncbi:hypothetical protein [Pelomicrobium sp. G1]|jgi:hypothetical protein|uniref:hypothetical protein n=1 Tax=unclassified Pelomicrobium TaxID=2815318 RepID=UPI0034918800